MQTLSKVSLNLFNVLIEKICECFVASFFMKMFPFCFREIRGLVFFYQSSSSFSFFCCFGFLCFWFCLNKSPFKKKDILLDVIFCFIYHFLINFLNIFLFFIFFIHMLLLFVFNFMFFFNFQVLHSIILYLFSLSAEKWRKKSSFCVICWTKIAGKFILLTE